MERYTLRCNPELCEAVMSLNSHLGRDWLNTLIRSDLFQSKVPNKAEGPLRKLSILVEPGNKLRYITIGDFWSQNALLPIHNYFMKILRSIKEDATYASSESFNYLLNQPYNNSKIYCEDLENYTDTFPIVLQEIIVELYLGKEVAGL